MKLSYILAFVGISTCISVASKQLESSQSNVLNFERKKGHIQRGDEGIRNINLRDEEIGDINPNKEEIVDIRYGKEGDVNDGKKGAGDVNDGKKGAGDVNDGKKGAEDVKDGKKGAEDVNDGRKGLENVNDGKEGVGYVTRRKEHISNKKGEKRDSIEDMLRSIDDNDMQYAWNAVPLVQLPDDDGDYSEGESDNEPFPSFNHENTSDIGRTGRYISNHERARMRAERKYNNQRNRRNRRKLMMDIFRNAVESSYVGDDEDSDDDGGDAEEEDHGEVDPITSQATGNGKTRGHDDIADNVAARKSQNIPVPEPEEIGSDIEEMDSRRNPKPESGHLYRVAQKNEYIPAPEPDEVGSDIEEIGNQRDSKSETEHLLPETELTGTSMAVTVHKGRGRNVLLSPVDEILSKEHGTDSLVPEPEEIGSDIEEILPHNMKGMAFPALVEDNMFSTVNEVGVPAYESNDGRYFEEMAEENEIGDEIGDKRNTVPSYKKRTKLNHQANESIVQNVGGMLVVGNLSQRAQISRHFFHPKFVNQSFSHTIKFSNYSLSPTKFSNQSIVPARFSN